MGPRERRDRAKQALRREILDAARDLFVKEGYENVSMRRIAEKIGYSPTTIYLHFKDKAELLFSICEETFAKLAERMEANAQEHGDPIDGLRRGCRDYIEFGVAYPNHYRVTFMHSQEHSDDAAHYLREGSMGMKAFGCLAAAVGECVRQGKFRINDVELISQMLWAAGHGVTSLLITKRDFPWVNKEKLIDTMIDTVIEGLKA